MDALSVSRRALHRRAAAWGVHLFTACGGVAGLLAALAVERGDWMACFAWLGVAVLIDAVDGTLARLARVKEVAPNLDGDLLDNLVDFVTYAFVPALLLYESGLLPDRFALAGAAAVMLSSGYQFSQTDAKTEANTFKGFPSYWNILAFYLLVLDLDPWINLLLLAVCVVLVFVPIEYAYPSRMTRYQRPTLALSAIWAAAMVAMWFLYPDVPAWLAWASLAYVVYYLAISLALTRGRNEERGTRKKRGSRV
jgi:phosphatidylcholine synthase